MTMTTRTTINGVSTCHTAGTEKYEKYQTSLSGYLSCLPSKKAFPTRLSKAI